MINLKSKTLTNYYGNNPDEYNIKFIHHNKKITTCLVKGDLILYKIDSPISHICNEDYYK